MSNDQVAITTETACIDATALVTDAHHPHARLRSIERLPNHRVLSELLSLNRQQRQFEAELLLFLGELDRRQLYREQAVSSAFAFCVERLGYSEDVAYKRVGAARLLRRFPTIYGWIADGCVHLTALMLIKPQLTEDNHEEWLTLICGKSKRQVEQLVASRCPRPDVPSSIRKLPEPKPAIAPVGSPADTATTTNATTDDEATRNATTTTPARATTSTSTNAIDAAVTYTLAVAVPTPSAISEPPVGMPTATAITSAQPMPQPKVTPLAQLTPLSGSTYRVTFTASERLKQKLDRARELLSHCVNPTNLPALFERALDELLEREEKRRYGVARPKASKARMQASRDMECSSTRASQELAHRAAGKLTPRPASAGTKHDACQCPSAQLMGAKDPDPNPLELAPLLPREKRKLPATPPHRDATPLCSIRRKRRRWIPAQVRPAVFERDSGQCTYIDARGRRCQERYRLELDHIDAHALGGPDAVDNMRLRCKHHNMFTAEQLFGRAQIRSAIRHAKGRSRTKPRC